MAVHRRVGASRSGDVYDAMTMPNKMGSMLVANVRADPANTAIAMAELRAAFRVAGLHADPPRILLQELNWLANGYRGGGRVCAAHVVINPSTGALEFCTAGPVGAVIIADRDTVRTLTDPKVDRLGSGEAIELPRQAERLADGEMLALYTPSCAALRNADGRELGNEGFVKALCRGAGLPPADLLDDLQHDLAEYLSGGRQEDDITVLLLFRRQ
jgi:serine phosphatase RsbU (regulator of sigma subunit)